MPAVLSSDEVVREDLSDALILSDRRNTPITSRIKKGEKLKAMLFSWPAERGAQRRLGGIPENKDVDAFETDSQQRLYGRAERWWRTPRVSVIAEKVNEVAGVTGSKFNHQVTKKVKGQKQDIEYEICSDQESAEDTGVASPDGHAGGDVMRGLGTVINDTVTGAGTSTRVGGGLGFTDTPTAIPNTFRTPTAQIYAGTMAAFDEVALNTLLQGQYDLFGAAMDVSLFVASGLKSYISANFGKYVPNKTGYTVVTVRSGTQLTENNAKLIASGIDVYEGDFGTFDITLEPFMPTDKRGYGLNMDQLEMRPLMYCDLTELPYQGGGISGLIDSILGYAYGDPRSHFKIAPSDEVARAVTSFDSN